MSPAPATLPPAVARFRARALEAALAHLPDELLSALALGLERHAGRLVSGRLYGGRDGGGCAVGVMLRELSPAAYAQGRLAFWRRRRAHRSIVTECVALDAALVTRLSHIELCFDLTALALREHQPSLDARAAANATGRWLAECCREQLRARGSDYVFTARWPVAAREPVAVPEPVAAPASFALAA